MADNQAANFRGSSIDGNALKASNRASCATSSASSRPTIACAVRTTAARYRDASSSNASRSPSIAATTSTSSGGSPPNFAILSLQVHALINIETPQSEKVSSALVETNLFI